MANELSSRDILIYLLLPPDHDYVLTVSHCSLIAIMNMLLVFLTLDLGLIRDIHLLPRLFPVAFMPWTGSLLESVRSGAGPL